MEATVVQCAEGHVFSTSTFPMQNLRSGRIGPGRLLRCPRCARLRQAVPVQAPGTASAAAPGAGPAPDAPYPDASDPDAPYVPRPARRER
ncbi:hypothetical protein DB35_22375 [Streptomyces abyssalis]|uniref:Formate-dependent nitrite reductase complex subunit NrfF n=1 Tax=Streptomyces abyssalis TaxID=933944 RepID=A0A1E7JPF2_9ACTN|nr:hypothetical protein DB35_22375 [Streptomyces abyssalis]OEU90120.1 hypothetical protein AN215_11130 [Streptomyces abyssalis]OEV29087.1 hypothetical protein AN219_18405 [Streptomyces nanshensis]